MPKSRGAAWERHRRGEPPPRGERHIAYDGAAQAALADGVELLARVARATLGPRGRLVGVERSYGQTPLFTRETWQGVRTVELSDPFVDSGVRVLKDAMYELNQAHGDGAATLAVVAEATLREARRHLAAGVSQAGLRRGLEQARRVALEALERQAQPLCLEDQAALASLAGAAAGDAALGALVAEALATVGERGAVVLQDWTGGDCRVEYIEGLQFDGGLISREFVTESDRTLAILQKPYLLLTEHTLTAAAQVLPALEAVAAGGGGSLAVVATDVTGEALGALSLNHARGTVRCVAVKAPAFQQRRADELQDMAILSGGTAFLEGNGRDLTRATLADLGRAEKLLAAVETTTLMGGAGETDAILARIAELEGGIESATYEYDRMKLRERIAKLVGGVAVLRVGAAEVVQQQARRRAADSALQAARAALREGVVPGGGVALLRCALAVERARPADDVEVAAGFLALARGLEAPLRCLAATSSSPARTFERVRRAHLDGADAGWGYDVVADELADLVGRRVVDPLPATREALSRATSVASMIATVGAVQVTLGAKPAGEYEKWA